MPRRLLIFFLTATILVVFSLVFFGKNTTLAMRVCVPIIAQQESGKLRHKDLAALYSYYDYHAVWASRSAAKQAMKEALKNAGIHGLLAEEYAIATQAKSALKSALPSLCDDVRLSSAALTYVRHMTSGRYPYPIDSHISIYPSLRAQPVEQLITLLRSDNFSASLAALIPTQPEYARLQASLLYYKKLEEQGGWPIINLQTDAIDVGELDPRMPQIRRMLMLLGYDVRNLDSYAYDMSIQAIIEPIIRDNKLARGPTATTINTEFMQYLMRMVSESPSFFVDGGNLSYEKTNPLVPWFRRAMIYLDYLPASALSQSERLDTALQVALKRYAMDAMILSEFMVPLRLVHNLYLDIKKSPPDITKPIYTMGMSNAVISAIRERLSIEGFLTNISDKPEFFDSILFADINRYRTQRGLLANGLIDEDLITALNIPVSDRIEQIEMAMDWYRRSAVFDYSSGKHIIVNLPAYELIMMEEDHIRDTMKIVIGNIMAPTPLMKTAISDVTIYPVWQAPRRLFLTLFAPIQAKEPNFFHLNGFSIRKKISENTYSDYDHHNINWSLIANRARADWQKLGESDFPYVLEQQISYTNPMGKLRIGLFNDLDIFLHDTPDRKIFLQPSPAVSAGCVRLKQADKLVRWILADTPEEKEFTQLSKAPLPKKQSYDHQRRVWLSKPVSVSIEYRTAWHDREGRLHFAKDIYGWDWRAREQKFRTFPMAL